MFAYIVRRLLLAAVTLTLVSMIAFSLVNLMPGNVIESRLADSPQARTDLMPKLTKELGLDRPKPIQFLDWYGHAIRGDLGNSLFSGESVNAAIGRTFPVTLEIAVLAIIASVGVATVLGTLAAIYQDRAIDHVTRFLTVGALAIPDFWIATLFIVFSSQLFGYALPISYRKLTDNPFVNLQLVGVASAIIGLRFSGTMTRMVRSSMLDVLRQDYMRTARAKGLTERNIIVLHGLRNAALPVLTLTGLQFAALLAGTVIIETVFSIPGTGQLTVTAIRTSDFTLVEGIVLVFGASLVLINLLVDLSYGVLDPRIRVHGSTH